jgi:UDP-N-acetylglucosamine 2-epimerase (non-hydrolysing)
MSSAPAQPLILCIVGARPNFTKIAPIMRALRAADSGLSSQLLHTGQHYDAAMKQSFFEQLQIPEPDIDLGVGSGSHAVQTAEIMLRFEPVLDRLQPAAVLVVGDVNSTIATALVAVKKGVPVIHVEAGLRSGDRTMPEEINRVLTDQISELLFTTEESAAGNLLREGIAAEKIHFAGNVMIDTLLYNLARATPAHDTLAALPGGEALRQGFGLVTLHRPSNVDDEVVLARLLGVPCITLRENTERPITVEQGTNTLAGTDPDRIRAAWVAVKAGGKAGRVPPLWDGKAAERIAAVIRDWCAVK